MEDWRSDPVTQNQLNLIKEMWEFSPYPLPEFEGTTKGEAKDYISKYWQMAHESTWGMENGYGR